MSEPTPPPDKPNDKDVLWQNPKTAGKESDWAGRVVNKAQGLKVLGEEAKKLTDNLDDTQPAEVADELLEAKKLSKRVPKPKANPLTPDDLKD